MLAHSFNRFYAVTKFILPMMDDLNLSPINYDKECKYVSDLDDNENKKIKTNIKALITYCATLRPHMAFFYKMQINACNKTVHQILKNEVDLILPKFPESRNSNRGIFSTIISGFVGLAFEGILSFLHNSRHKALHKAVLAMSSKVDIQRNKLMHLEATLVIYGVYNAETLEKLIKTVHTLHNRQSMYESLFTGQIMLYNFLLLINYYIGNSTIKCHSRSMSDNRDLTETFHQNISSHCKVIASAF